MTERARALEAAGGRERERGTDVGSAVPLTARRSTLSLVKIVWFHAPLSYIRSYNDVITCAPDTSPQIRTKSSFPGIQIWPGRRRIWISDRTATPSPARQVFKLNIGEFPECAKFTIKWLHLPGGSGDGQHFLGSLGGEGGCCTSFFGHDSFIEFCSNFRSMRGTPEIVRFHAPLSYRGGTSLVRKRTPLGPYRRPMPRVLGGS